MTSELVELAHKLEEAANNYKELFVKEYQNEPVIWLRNDNTNKGIFLTDSFNTKLFINKINNM